MSLKVRILTCALDIFIKTIVWIVHDPQSTIRVSKTSNTPSLVHLGHNLADKHAHMHTRTPAHTHTHTHTLIH